MPSGEDEMKESIEELLNILGYAFNKIHCRYGVTTDGEPPAVVCINTQAEIIRRFAELEKENERLSNREGNARINLLCPTDIYPFRQINLEIIDYGVSDNIYLVRQPKKE